MIDPKSITPADLRAAAAARGAVLAQTFESAAALVSEAHTLVCSLREVAPDHEPLIRALEETLKAARLDLRDAAKAQRATWRTLHAAAA